MTALPSSCHHVRAAIFALLASALLIFAATVGTMRLEKRYVHGLAPHLFTLKNQGVALQKLAFEQPDLLPIYGSSELVKPVPDKASQFFRHYPTNFNVFPVGKAGATPLIILQKLAAVGPAVRARKIVISISPGWFFDKEINAHSYAGNFSSLHAGSVVFSHELGQELKRDAARRMLAFPQTLTARPLIAAELAHLADDTSLDRTLLRLMWPVGELEQVLARLADHFETAIYIMRQRALHASPHRRPSRLNWERLIARASEHMKPIADESNASVDAYAWKVGGEAGFLATLDSSAEWIDLELLLRGMHDLGACPLLLSMPINGVYFDRAGISSAARKRYYERLRALAAKYDVALVDFQDHEEDPKFLVDHHDHLSVEGWMFYDEMIDEFFHDRIPSVVAAHTHH